MKSKKRFEYVDGLRGVAAMMVVVYHFTAGVPTASLEQTPSWLTGLFHQGRLGVDVFFVISGFVITHSLRQARFSFSYVWRFAVRRSVRLDPPFWTTIALELLLIQLGLFLIPDLGTRVPTLGEILANATYVYRFFGLPDVVGVFWSLTYEVQFYLVLVVSLTMLQPRSLTARGRQAASLLFLGSVIYSILVWVGLLDLPVSGLFVDRWYQFALGATAWAYARGMTDRRVFWGLLTFSTFAAFMFAGDAYRFSTTAMTVLTAASLAHAASEDKMHWLSGDMMQFLGKTSYSLYLLHVPIGGRVLQVGKRFLGENAGLLLDYSLVFLSIAASVGAAWAMYRILEAPSIKLARRIDLPTRDRKEAADATLAMTPP